MKHFKQLFLVLIALLIPAIAFAGNINPPGGNTWDMYVYGNARVIFDILGGVKMLMVPDAGSTGFMTLLLLLATIGFLVLAISAGFDPGKNLMRMFTYIFVVYFVVFSTTKLTANVNIIDMIKDPQGMSASYVVSDAPALVVMPAALTSEIGRYFTRTIESYFVLPDEFKLSGMSGGQFNLFGKLMKESSEYILTNQGIKQTLNAYASDCVVPAIAQGRLSGPGWDPINKKETTVYGVSSLLQSTNLSTTLRSATHKAIMTKYYPAELDDEAWRGKVSTLDSQDYMTQQRAMSMGVLVSCEIASDLLFDSEWGQLPKYAQGLMDKGSSSWSKLGVAAPFESVMQAMIAQAGAAGSVGAGYTRPHGVILQSALINTMNGSFKQAAVQSGNNEIMQSVAIAQAEQSQKSSWVASAQVFNNMMGYIYVTLQAFIFALTPLIVVALLVPGLGKSIFVNYAQILIWLMLWQPMLALINFLITLFGVDSLSTIVSMDGGMSPNNKYLITEKTNDLMVAAGFLGSMIPLLAWGLVKGTLAFTEFISAGVGSAFANQAGAQAATGNVSMGNSSMDNVSMNKFNTAMSSAVGNQGVAMYNSAGSINSSADMGGTGVQQNMSAISSKAAAAQSVSEAKAYQQAYSSAVSEASSMSYSQVKSAMDSGSVAQGSAKAQAFADMLAVADSKGYGSGAKEGSTMSEAATQAQIAAEQVAAGAGSKAALNASAEIGVKGSIGSIGGGISGGADGSMYTDQSSGTNYNTASGLNTSAGSSAGVDRMVASSNTGVTSSQASSISNTVSSSVSSSHAVSTADAQAWGEAVGLARANSESVSQSLQKQESSVNSLDFSRGVDVKEAQNILNEVNSTMARLTGDADSAINRLGGDQASFNAKNIQDTFGSSHVDKDVGSRVDSEIKNINPNTYAPAGRSSLVKNADEITNKSAEFIRSKGAEIDSHNKTFTDEAKNSIKTRKGAANVTPSDKIMNAVKKQANH